jgi:hypothetical protein
VENRWKTIGTEEISDITSGLKKGKWIVAIHCTC